MGDRAPARRMVINAVSQLIRCHPRTWRPIVAKKPAEFDFEKALGELESLVEKMEQGDLTLEESLRQFERGVALTRACQKALAEAEQKVQILLQNTGGATLRPFDAPDNGAED